MKKKINFWFFLFLILLFVPLKNSFAVNIGNDNSSSDLIDNYSYDSYRYGIQIIPSSNVTVTKLAVVQPDFGPESLGRIILALYSDNGSDVPNTLLGQTSIGSMSYGGSNLELTLSSSINLTANTKYWIVPIPADGHGSYLGFKYDNCMSDGTYIEWESQPGGSNPTTPPSNWTDLPNASGFSYRGCNLGYYAVAADADTTAPTLSSSSPADNATSVSESANIVLNFSESVDVESGNITIKKTSDDSTVETISVTGGLVSGSGSSQITVNPSVTLDSSTEYYVLIDATAFDDSAGNS
ncbi:MAG: Ig-like domain-containing protein, partial [Flavobacteriaceae bacterium]